MAYRRSSLRYQSETVSRCNLVPLPTDWGNSGAPALPGWLTNGCLAGSPVSGWSAVIYYAVAKNRLESSGSGCTTCTASSLNVTNSTSGRLPSARRPARPSVRLPSDSGTCRSGAHDAGAGIPAAQPQLVDNRLDDYQQGISADPNSTVNTEKSDNSDTTISRFPQRQVAIVSACSSSASCGQPDSGFCDIALMATRLAACP